MLQSSRLEGNMKTIGIEQSSFTRSSFEHRCMNNIKKIYQHADKCDYQQNIKDLFLLLYYLLQRESHVTVLMCLWHQHQSRNQVLVNHCVYSPPYWMLNQKTAKHRFVAAKSKRKAMKVGNSLFTKKKTKRAFKNQWAGQK